MAGADAISVIGVDDIVGPGAAVAVSTVEAGSGVAAARDGGDGWSGEAARTGDWMEDSGATGAVGTGARVSR